MFPYDYRALHETFSIFRQNFPKVVNSALYVSKVTLRGNFSLKKIKKLIPFWRMSQKTLSFSYQNAPWTTVKTDLFPSRPTIWMNWFSLEKVRFHKIFWILSGKNPTRLWNNYSTLTEQQLRKVVLTSNGMIFEIAFSLWKQFLDFWPKKFMKVVNTAFSAPRWSTFAKASFSWNKLNISIYFRTLKQKNVVIQRKPIYQNCQNCL